MKSRWCVATGALIVAALSWSLDGQSLRPLVGVTFEAKVTHVADGDTVDVVANSGVTVRVRLDGVDTPENGRAFSRVATNFTRSIVFDKTVLVKGTDVDRYGRLVARLLSDQGDLSAALVKAGLAWHYLCYSSDQELAALEREAKSAKRGLWSDPSVVPPWHCSGSASKTHAATVSREGPFIGNVSSKVYHATTCRNATCKNCIRSFGNEEAARAAGFRPAGDCLDR